MNDEWNKANNGFLCGQGSIKGVGYVLKNPEYSEWERHEEDIIRMVLKGKEPNWFHRKMQYLFFGWKWKRKSKCS